MSIPLILISLVVLIPMPIAGGTVPLIAMTCGLFFIASIKHFRSTVVLHPNLALVILIAFLMIAWEMITALVHFTRAEIDYIAIRIIWTMLGFAYFTIISADGPQQLVKNLQKVMLLSLLMLSTAMVIESTFYPTFAVGRQLGQINFPWPRATGVPQSDGKIGVFLCMSLILFTVAFVNYRSKLAFVGIVFSIIPVLFTQSRSSFLAMVVCAGFLYLYYLFSSRNPIVKTFSIVFAIVSCGLLIAFGADIYLAFKGEGIFARNVDVRGVGNIYGLNAISDFPLFGDGPKAIHVDGKGMGVHNTFIAMSVKSGLLLGCLFIVFVLASGLFACSREKGLFANLFLFLAVVSGPLSEHNLYPGLFNEHLWLMSLVAISIHYMEHTAPSRVAAENSQSRHDIGVGAAHGSGQLVRG